MKKIFFLISLFIPFYIFCETATELYNKGKVLLDSYKCYEASIYFNKAIALNPYYKEAYALAGDSYFCLENYIEAEKYYQKALFYDPENTNYILRLAKIKLSLARDPKQTLGAEYYIYKAYKINPRDPEVLRVYGDYYYKLGKLAEAMDTYQKVIKGSDDYLTYLRIATIYMRWKNYEKAYEYLLKAETIKSDDYRVTFSLANYYIEVKDYEKAVSYLELTLKIFPDFKDGLRKAIYFYIQREEYASAINKINHILKLDPLGIYYYYLGIAYLGLGRNEDAIRFFMEGIKKDSSDEMIRLKIDELVVKKMPLGYELRKDLGNFYFQKAKNSYEKGEYYKTVLLLKRALRINPLSLDIRKYLANIFRERGLINLFLNTLKSGLFVRFDQEIKDLIDLNNRFLWDKVSYKNSIDQYKEYLFLPEVLVSDIVEEDNNKHLFISYDLKDYIISALMNTYSINVKSIEKKEIDEIEKTNRLLLRLRFIEGENYIEFVAQLVNLYTGNIYKEYTVRKYGNDRLLNSIIELCEQVKRDVKPFGKIIKIDDDEAIISLGQLQGIKKGDKFIIYNLSNIVDSFYSGNPFNTPEVIGHAEVLEVDEMISKVKLYRSSTVVFNMINLDNIAVYRDNDDKKK
ncbi:MAG TPA: tetratricopeptide repeat protein [Spirochaetota bacterium]|nr:tetratricopeptide repeat protein [Spirochaetota bacterium]HOM37816.1 tetratricopeptide repeat protein [Spirochaetota bacterium]HPQ49307.1 tetratricopeptide repeat protein [Spirochaetota bacterium]